MSRTSWQDVMSEVERRIYTRQWHPGQLIPNESDLASEFGCARVTVNRALRTLAEAGLLDRRRKAGTSVALHPVGKATLQIPVIRKEIEAQDKRYDYHLLREENALAPAAICHRFQAEPNQKMRHVISRHCADGVPYVIEDRWINLTALPHLEGVSFAAISANEWLLQNTPFTHGDIGFGATNANAIEATTLNATKGAALFTVERTTWDHQTALTSVKLLFHPGYQMNTKV
ncbi:GntR family transcriptional regulator [Alphaproteobacteria bacterium]|jgi:GntR family transcriptional regulator, histidine utilization repressor|nr:GntR family transcriptional regulator [Alphaproteobacteria bacterium]|eukprot:GHVR01130588.1.p1 GENE.GHVR01130588.1~~GHVR01130588.1.p1  ORF type:complete len:231 (-),score=24.47 GHVR01130588.1:335-1027(-)